MCILCRRCNEWKEFDHYKSEKSYICTECRKKKQSEYHKGWREENKDKIKEYSRKYYENNREEVLKKNRQYQEAHTEKYREYSKKYRENSPEKIKQINKERYKNMTAEQRAQANESCKKYYQANREEILEKRKYMESAKRASKNWQNDHYYNDEIFRIAHNIRTCLTHAYRNYEIGKCPKYNEKYGLDYEAIFEHMGEIPDGYHYGYPLNSLSVSIDHIVPLRDFDLTKPDELAMAVAPLNHRWLKRIDNYNRQWDDGYDVERHREELYKRTGGTNDNTKD